MAIADIVYAKLKALAPSVQQEVLHYVEYLIYKSKQEELAWSEISLAAALRGLEHDAWPEYGAGDFKETWQ